MALFLLPSKEREISKKKIGEVVDAIMGQETDKSKALAKIDEVDRSIIKYFPPFKRSDLNEKITNVCIGGNWINVMSLVYALTDDPQKRNQLLNNFHLGEIRMFSPMKPSDNFDVLLDQGIKVFNQVKPESLAPKILHIFKFLFTGARDVCTTHRLHSIADVVLPVIINNCETDVKRLENNYAIVMVDDKEEVKYIGTTGASNVVIEEINDEEGSACALPQSVAK
jgi:hypothetical protein